MTLKTLNKIMNITEVFLLTVHDAEKNVVLANLVKAIITWQVTCL